MTFMKYKTGLFSLKSDGHRSDYNNFLMKILGQADFVKRSNGCEIMVFMMIEESFFGFFLTSIFRAFQGKKTTGLLFRLKPVVFAKNIRMYIKGIILKFLCLFKSIRIFSIHDPSLLPKGSTYVTDWIYDFQLWDFSDSPIRREIIDDRVKRNDELTRSDPITIVALGSQDENKGIIDLIRLIKLRNSINSNQVFKIYGKLDPIYENELLSVMSHRDVCINDYVSNEILWQGYKEADLIWAFYSPKYDQASGVAGRAAQFGVPVIVRSDSIISNTFKNLNIKAFSIEESSDVLSITREDLTDEECLSSIESVREISLLKIKRLVFQD